ncbi:AAA family ATPase [Salinibacter sp.]|uniref:AAA family ATPase n=1 Tax=Salinibacter sp. TaxID=2065818 RepID=UPI0021E743C1|nr:AAA family ATPase [Salinibacter sp.]
MSFHFKKLRIKDWLAYGGTTEIEFSDFTSGQNIVTIHGKNGYGKTSLLRALEFLFHDPLSREEYFEHWHDDAQEEGEGSMEVSLEFTYKDQLFKLIREVEFKPWSGDTTAATDELTLINGETGEPEDQAQEKIDLMIPEKSKQFVFFDGAEITRYAQKQHEEGVREAIERVLGIPAIRNLGDDLGKLINDLEEKQAEIGLLQDESQELVQEIDDLQDELHSYEEQKVNKEEKLQSIRESANELEKETAELAAIESKHSQLQEKKKRLRDYEDRRKELTQQIDRLLEQAPLHMLEGPLSQIVQQGQAQQSNGTPSRHGTYRQQKKLIESLLDEDECVCGKSIDEEAEEHLQEEAERLSELMERTKDSSDDSMFTFSELSSLSATLEQIRKAETNGEEIMDRRAAIDDKIEEIETDIHRLERELEGHEDANVRENMRLQRQLANQASDLEKEIEGLEENIKRVSDEIQEKQRRLDHVTSQSKEGKQVTETLQTSRGLKGAVEAFVDRLVSEKHETIQATATDVFNGITNKPEEYAGINVKDDYTLEVYRHDGTTVENEKLSAGEKEVLAYSFITALNLSSPNPAPFVMDTPFGHLDSQHRDRLLQSLHQLDVQVFLLATDRDLPPAERERLQNHIADEFVIQRDQDEARSYIDAQ